MEKCSSILVAIADVATADVVLIKAGLLAARFGARIDVLVTGADTTRAVAQRCAELGLGDRLGSLLHAAGGSANDAIVERLESRTDLVMKAAGSSRALRRVLRAAEDLSLAARLPVPLLRVGERKWRRELRLGAAVDASDRDGDAVARSILHAAGLVAMRCDATLDVLYCERETHDERLRMERAVRVARLVREFRIGGERLRLLSGEPDTTLPRAIAAGEYDIVVIGAVPRRPSGFRWSPSPTSVLTHAATGDVMLVPESQRIADGTPPSHDVTHP